MKVHIAPRALTPFCVICASTAIGCKCLPFFVFAVPLEQFREAQLSLKGGATSMTQLFSALSFHRIVLFKSLVQFLHFASSLFLICYTSVLPKAMKFLSFHMCIFPAFSNLAFVSAAKSVVYKLEQSFWGLKDTYKNISCILLIWNKWTLQLTKWMWWCKWDHKSTWPGKLLSAMFPSCPWKSSHSL